MSRTLDVICGRHKGSKAFAVICLAGAIRNNSYPAGWTWLDGTKASDHD